VGRRAQLRVVRALPAPDQGLRDPQSDSLGIPSPRVHPLDVAKAMQGRMNFWDRL
jgi:hypothetical protein